jgi:hypothetical protein
MRKKRREKGGRNEFPRPRTGELLVYHYGGKRDPHSTRMHPSFVRNYSPSVGTCAEVTSWDGSSSKDAALASSTSIQPGLSIPLLMEFTAETRRGVESN